MNVHLLGLIHDTGYISRIIFACVRIVCACRLRWMNPSLMRLDMWWFSMWLASKTDTCTIYQRKFDATFFFNTKRIYVMQFIHKSEPDEQAV
jgi:hypothetical protein